MKNQATQAGSIVQGVIRKAATLKPIKGGVSVSSFEELVKETISNRTKPKTTYPYKQKTR